MNQLKTFPKVNKPLSICMWYNWGFEVDPKGAYYHLEKKLDELIERGFDTIRVESYPLLVADGLDGGQIWPMSHYDDHRDKFIKIDNGDPEYAQRIKRISGAKWLMGGNFDPAVDLPRWGMAYEDHERDMLLLMETLANECRKRNIYLGLANWKLPRLPEDPLPREMEESYFTSFASYWVDAIQKFREAGVLERTLWLEPFNEEPWFFSRYIKDFINAMQSAQEVNEGELAEYWNSQSIEVFNRCNNWLFAPIASELENDDVLMCLSTLGNDPHSKILPSVANVVDIHHCPSPATFYGDEEHAFLENIGAKGFLRWSAWPKVDLKKFSHFWNRFVEKHMDQMIHDVDQFCKHTFENCAGITGPVIFTEGWGPCYHPDHPDVDWSMYKEYNARAIRTAMKYPFAGLSTSNYSCPTFRLWGDIAWHRQSNDLIRTEPVETA